MTTVQEIKDRLERSKDIKDLVGAIKDGKDSADQFTKQYNQGIKNGK
jgi:hypothetical protein